MIRNAKLASLSLVVVMCLFATVPAVPAQDANPITSNLKQSWVNTRDLLVKLADAMPEDGYRFKPTPEIQDFGQRMAHVINFNMRACVLLKGEQRTLTFGPAPSKAEIAAAMKDANNTCDSAINSLTDSDVLTMVTAARGGPRTKLSLIEGNILEHSQEVYGYLAVYLRLKGIVPPSSNRNER